MQFHQKGRISKIQPIRDYEGLLPLHYLADNTTYASVEMASLYRPVHKADTPRPLSIRREAHESHVSGIQPTSDAPNYYYEPYRDGTQPDWKGQERGAVGTSPKQERHAYQKRCFTATTLAKNRSEYALVGRSWHDDIWWRSISDISWESDVVY